MSTSNWVDERLSSDLPALRAHGEGQDLEYMEVFPQQVRELAKEVAAFASTNPGTILLGVSDVGDIVGLPGISSPSQRDELLRRVEGICRGTIRPSITPTIRWAVETDRIVLVIQVPKGTEPVYYSNGIPYVRHLSESRPAEPHEVIELVRAWLATEVKEERADPFNELLNELALLVIETLIYAEESEERDLNPWLDQWRAQYELAASRLREMAANRLAIEHGLSPDLTNLAAVLDTVASFRLYLGCAAEFDPLKLRALEFLREVKHKYVDPMPLSDASLVLVREEIERVQRLLDSLRERMSDMVNRGQSDDVQAEAGHLGFILLKLSHYNVDGLLPELSQRLRGIGRPLHLVETMPIYLDGGRSTGMILQRIETARGELQAVVDEMER